MELTVGKQTFNITAKDRILDNGTAYVLITRQVSRGYDHYSPQIPKALFQKLLKDDKIELAPEKYRSPISNEQYNLYRFKGV